MHADKSTKARFRGIVGLTSFLFLLVIMATFLTKKATAADSIAVKEINYKNSTITLQLNSADTEVYFSDSTKKNWETVPGVISNTKTITMDISWVPTSSNYIITFKGNKSTSILSVMIPKQVSNFKATFNKVKNSVAFSNTGSRTIEWRKKDSTIWNTVDTGTIGTQLSLLYNNGATIFFRLAPVNGTSNTNVGARPSKEVSVAITKKTAAPTITINGSKFSIPVKKGMAYRLVNNDGSTTEWTTINSSTELFLRNIAASAMYTNATTVQSEVTLQFRTNATSSAQVSQIATVTIPVQEGAPDETTYGISLSYTSSTTLSLQVKAASATVPFEYTVVKAGDELNYQTASWTAISSSTAVSFSSTKAPAGCHIYVRKKSIAVTSTTVFALASVEKDITGSGGVTYPNAMTASNLSTLISTSGVCKTSDSSSYLTFALYSPTSTTVSSISFLDVYGIEKGSVTSKSTVVKNTKSTNDNDKYIITTKITSTSEIDDVTEEMLYAKLTLANSEVITSTATSGVLIYLYPSTKVNNPEEDEDYTNSFKRVYLSTDENDETTFKFQLDFGTQKVMDTTAVNTYTNTAMAISSMKLDGYTLTKNTDYTVEYGTYINDDDETVATATVTVKVASFEGSSLINTTDQALPLKITLNNNEVIDDNIYITLIRTATINNTPLAWSITEGSLKETTTSIITNSDDSKTTVTQEVITYTITLNIFDSSYEVGVSDVTWGGTSIFGSASVSNGKITIYLSNAKINKLTTTSTDTKNIVFTLSNGYVIKTGCKLTILDASK